MSNEREEFLIIRNLILNEGFFSEVVNFVEPEYFTDSEPERKLVGVITDFAKKYKNRPDTAAIRLEAARLPISETTHNAIRAIIDDVEKSADQPTPEAGWLRDKAEQFCRDKAMYCAILKSISIMDGSEKRMSKGDIPLLVQQALGISFDSRIGHDFIDHWEEQFDFYNSKIDRLPFHLDSFNEVTRGGMPRKTLLVLMSNKTGGFKSGTMCDLGARAYLGGKNVLYITLEMSENMIRQRIDANLMEVKIDDLDKLSKDFYQKKIEFIRARTPGRFVVHEYPTGGAHVGHFRFLLKELKMKKGFKPDWIFVDYLGICACQKLAGSQGSNSYAWNKGIAEELRGLAIEQDVALVTAVQSGRQGHSAGDDLDVDDVSESYGIPMTADVMWAVITTQELDDKGMIMFKQLKNRFYPPQRKPRITVGCNKDLMTLFDLSATGPRAEFVPPSARKDEPDMVVTGPIAKEEARSRGSFEEWT